MNTTYKFGTAHQRFTDQYAGFSIESVQTTKQWQDVQGSVGDAQTRILPCDWLSTGLRIADRLEKLALLEDDWDGMDAVAPSTLVVAHAKVLAALLNQEISRAELQAETPDCDATPTGGIELSWEKENFELSLLLKPSLPTGQVIVLDGDGITASRSHRFGYAEASAYVVERLRSFEKDR